MASQISHHPRRASWRTIVLVGGVLIVLLLLSLAAGVLVGNQRNSLAILFVIGPVVLFGTIILTRWFDTMVLILPFCALAVPFTVPTGTETKLPAALFLAVGLCGVWIATMVVRSRFVIAPSPLNKPALVFGAICCISLVWGIIWRDPVLIDAPKFIFTQTASLICFLASIGAMLLIGNFVKTTGQLKVVMMSFVIMGTLLAVIWLFHLPLTFLEARGLWGMWLIAPAYSLLITHPNIRWYWRTALAIAIVLALYLAVVVNADWISGWLPNLVAIVAITFLHSRKAFIALVVIAVITLYATRGFFEQVATDNIDDGSLERISLWEQSWSVVQQHWLLGTGPAGYAIYYMTYYRDDARSTHNNYLDILAQFGFSGMLAWIWLGSAGVIEGWRIIRCAPPGWLRTVSIAATGGWVAAQVAMVFGDWVLPFAYNQGVAGYKYTVYTWIFLGMLISVRQLLASPPEAIKWPKVGGKVARQS